MDQRCDELPIKFPSKSGGPNPPLSANRNHRHARALWKGNAPNVVPRGAPSQSGRLRLIDVEISMFALPSAPHEWDS
jgi:hypothetical protein